MPTGINTIPITKNVGRIVTAVRIGFQAGSRCCLNALSVPNYVTCVTNIFPKIYNI